MVIMIWIKQSDSMSYAFIQALSKQNRLFAVIFDPYEVYTGFIYVNLQHYCNQSSETIRFHQ